MDEQKATSTNFHKNETNIFQLRTEQASSIKDLLLWPFTNVRTAKRISIGKHASERRKTGTNYFRKVIFVVFTKVIGKKGKNKVSTSYNF